MSDYTSITNKEIQPAPPTSRGLTDNLLESSHNSVVLHTKLTIAANGIKNLKRHVYLHAAVGIGMVLFLFGFGYWVFSHIFFYLMSQPVFGSVLMDRLVGIVLMIFFAMLLFSNLIITLSTTYISKEVEFLMGLPLSRLAIFRQKLFESIIYSSWAFAMLSLPLFVSYGVARHANWYFYLLIIPAVIPFIAIPAILGSIFTILVTSWLPARKTRILLVVLAVLSGFASLALAKYSGLAKLLATADDQDFLQIMNALSFGSSPLLPSTWLSAALTALAPANPQDLSLSKFAYWTAMLLSTSLFLLELCRWLVPSLYYRGWCLSRDAAFHAVNTNTRLSPFYWIDLGLTKVFRPPTAGLLSKDLKTFWRDPTQWSQLIILFVLMIIYVMNLRWSAKYNATMSLVVNNWKDLLSFFNLAATCFILSILTTRFVYPMLSLEGRSFWTVGLAPIRRSKIVWQKFVLCFLLCLGVSLPLTILSNEILEVSNNFVYLSIGMVFLLSAGLTSLSVGIGAILPDFKEDNPARIANGIGGTLNILLSLSYISCSVTLLAIPTMLTAFLNDDSYILGVMDRWETVYYSAYLIFQAFVVILPMKIGLKRWNQLEF